jgi:hypothetical protein
MIAIKHSPNIRTAMVTSRSCSLYIIIGRNVRAYDRVFSGDK